MRQLLHHPRTLVAVGLMGLVSSGLVGQTEASRRAPLSAAEEEVDFERDVLPIFRTHCLDCHGPDLQESELRLDRRKSLLQGGYSGEPTIVPGDHAASFLLRVVSAEGADGLMMPPDGDPLSGNEVAILEKWITAGAKMPAAEAEADESPGSGHWSLQPLTRPAVPAFQSGRTQTTIDLFLARRLQAEGLALSPTADRRTLIRRLYLVMLGVPPRASEVQRFIEDGRPQAYERLVDRVLSDPRFGERWASHWLDLVRFGETHGFETNRERPAAFHYRDYVIDAFNEDLRYDRFVQEQIAGDALGRPVGTGFLVAGPHDIVKSPDINLTLMQRQDELTDIVNTTGTAFLGLTVGCARCHNHKFDPISQKDFYAMQAVFAGVEHAAGPLPPSQRDQDQIRRYQTQLAELRTRLLPYVAADLDPLLTIRPQAAGMSFERGLHELVASRGVGTLAAGSALGQAQDIGAVDRPANLSEGYQWYDNVPNQNVLAYQPVTRGRYRVWLSWGWGWHTHTSSATYWLDQDGELNTVDDQLLLAEVDQRLAADAQVASAEQREALLKQLPSEPRWSGPLSVGVHELTPQSKIVLRGGEEGTAITADLVFLERVDPVEQAPASSDGVTANSVSINSTPAEQGLAADEAPSRFPWRSPARATRNVEWLEPTSARFLRFRIQSTAGGTQPCLDELEVWADGQNVALASFGTRVELSGTLPGYDIHQPQHVNDGRYGNDHSWISNTAGTGEVVYEFPQTVKIERIEWSRDRGGRFSDRVPQEYVIEVAEQPGQWREVASHRGRLTANDLQMPPVTFTAEAAQPAERERIESRVAQLESLARQLDELMQPSTAYIGKFTQPPVTHRLYRGDPMAPREAVAPDTLAILDSLELSQEAPERERRLALAKSLTDPSQPLPARVMVNRLWQHVFGTGLVETPSDFGANGIPPTHPELLDWLASEFIYPGLSADDTIDARSWSTKHVLRLLVLSQAFRQSAQPHQAGNEVDASARLLWRFPTRRLSAEAIRDSMLAVAGTLQPTMHGPGFSAFEVELENVRHYFPKTDYGVNDWRRMVYMTKVRQEKDGVFGAFDCPDGSQVQPRRSRSTTPLQALNLFNSPFTLQQAELMVERIEEELGREVPLSQFVLRAYELAYGRSPSKTEQTEAVSFIESQPASLGKQQLCRVILNSNEFLFVP